MAERVTKSWKKSHHAPGLIEATPLFSIRPLSPHTHKATPLHPPAQPPALKATTGNTRTSPAQAGGNGREYVVGYDLTHQATAHEAAPTPKQGQH